MARTKGNSARVRRSSTSAAPSRSCTLAACTTMFSSSPSVSTRTWYLTPLTFLPASKPTGSTDGPPLFRRLDRLAVEDGGRGASGAVPRTLAGLLAAGDVELVVPGLQR